MNNTSEDAGLSGTGRLHDLEVSCESMTPSDIKAQGKGLTLGFGVTPTCFGMALIGWTPIGICHLAFCDNNLAEKKIELETEWPLASFVQDDSRANHYADQIFTAHPPKGTLHVVLKGTHFQIKVWEALLTTRSAQLLSYRQLAVRVGSPKAQRAVGSAVAANKIGYLIPCHRVIRASGEVGQYRWGMRRKKALQVWEMSHYRAQNPSKEVSLVGTD